MQDNSLRDAIATARRAVEAEEEPYRSAAFTVILEHLLKKDSSVSPPAAETARPPAGTSVAAGMQLNEFLALKSPKTHPDRVTAIAYYYHHEQSESITMKNVTEAYARARLKKPQNISDVISTCVRRGYLTDTEKKDSSKAWIITQAGDTAVEEGF